jgi:hypothetical protein
VVVVAFQIIFHFKIYKNNIFYILKLIFILKEILKPAQSTNGAVQISQHKFFFFRGAVKI